MFSIVSYPPFSTALDAYPLHVDRRRSQCSCFHDSICVARTRIRYLPKRKSPIAFGIDFAVDRPTDRRTKFSSSNTNFLKIQSHQLETHTHLIHIYIYICTHKRAVTLPNIGSKNVMTLVQKTTMSSGCTIRAPHTSKIIIAHRVK